ncbi:MAG: helix-turn-helix domain-containing protein [Nitrospirota bacterium]|nr:helix-turn-helix domain-containing protein [Nitrospirota bacterium]
MSATDDLLTPQELAVRLRLSLRSVRRLVAAGAIPFRLVGTVKRFVWAEVVSALPKGPVMVSRPSAAPKSIDMVGYLKEKARNWPFTRKAVQS